MRRAAGKDLSGCSPVGPEELEREVMAALHGTGRVGVVHWYASLASSWLKVEPPMRHVLMLRTHQWIAERVLTPRRQDMLPAAEDLKAGGALVQGLLALIPPGQPGEWRGWIRLVVLELKRALRWEPAKRNEAWAHWLFLIPYSVQAGRAPENRGGMPWNSRHQSTGSPDGESRPKTSSSRGYRAESAGPSMSSTSDLGADLVVQRPGVRS